MLSNKASELPIETINENKVIIYTADGYAKQISYLVYTTACIVIRSASHS